MGTTEMQEPPMVIFKSTAKEKLMEVEE